ncbi:MAG: hydrogenase expression/formation protein HypE [Synechococcaceae cyanobacterium]|nr:hydrogenase expression/formation protein HypE [Synechococcaceae cyanobacterium]
MTERIRLAHGGGGTLMQRLIHEELLGLYGEPAPVLHDAARLALPPGPLAFTTDGYVVRPLEFPGGDIGSLAVTGTANDLAMAGARPLHLSVGLILEEGLELAVLRRIVASMAAAARRCGVSIATGDTKVVERGKGDGLFVTTSGIGRVEAPGTIDPTTIEPGDALLVSGDLGRHGVAILAARHGLDLQPPLESDCMPLWPLVERLLARGVRLHCLRDLTRGGLASALQELAEARGVELRLEEERIPVAGPVARTCELLGFEPLHLANEGRFVAVLPEADVAAALAVLAPLGGAWIGAVRPGTARVLLRTPYGSERVLVPVSGELLPRIC